MKTVDIREKNQMLIEKNNCMKIININKNDLI